MVAGQRIALPARRVFLCARSRQRGPRLIDGGAKFTDIGQRGLALPNLRQGRERLIALDRDPGQLVVGRGQPSSGGGGDQWITPRRGGPPRDDLLFGGDRGLGGRFGCRPGGAGGRCLLFRRRQPRAQADQPVALLQPHRRLSRRPGSDGIAVPAPDGACA